MTKIKMLKTMSVSPTGLYTETWAAGTERECDADLLSVLIEAGAVEIAENKAVAAAPERKRRRGKS
jgi:hypothetical protein